MRHGFKELTERLVEFRNRRDWAQFHNPKDLAMGISIEAGELLECFLWKSPEEVKSIATDPMKKVKLSDEIADIVIYSFLFAERSGIDLYEAILKKIEKNAKRYPEEKVRGSAEKAE